MKKKGSRFHITDKDICQVFHLLVSHGHDVNLMGEATRRLHYNGGAMHMAAEYSDVLMAKLIVGHGGDPNITSIL